MDAALYGGGFHESGGDMTEEIFKAINEAGLTDFADSIGFVRNTPSVGTSRLVTNAWKMEDPTACTPGGGGGRVPSTRGDGGVAAMHGTMEGVPSYALGPFLGGRSEGGGGGGGVHIPDNSGVDEARTYIVSETFAKRAAHVERQGMEEKKDGPSGRVSGVRRRLDTGGGDPSALSPSRGGAGEGGGVVAPAMADSPPLTGGRKRKKSRTTPVQEKGGKGLRHFSLQVCQKVEDKGRTSYNEVADELVAELVGQKDDPNFVKQGNTPYDEKNIRRRVYDALNVLMALEVITKEKKEISWKGLPKTHDQKLEQLKAQRLRVQSRVDNKRNYLKELLDQYDCLRALLKKNEHAALNRNGSQGISLPFVIVQTKNDAQVEVEMSDDLQTVNIDFDTSPFEVHDYFYVLKNMNLGGRKQNEETGNVPQNFVPVKQEERNARV